MFKWLAQTVQGSAKVSRVSIVRAAESPCSVGCEVKWAFAMRYLEVAQERYHVKRLQLKQWIPTDRQGEVGICFHTCSSVVTIVHEIFISGRASLGQTGERFGQHSCRRMWARLN
jgi:hypothetical protein